MVFFALILTGILVPFQSVKGQQAASFFDLLYFRELPEVKLSAPMQSIIEEKKKSDQAYKAILSWKTDGGAWLNAGLKLKHRGKTRRRICDMPPLSLDFAKDTLQRMGLNPEYDKFKLVTHCKNNKEAEKILLKEYLIYQLFQVVQPVYFRAKLLNIHYLNPAIPDVDSANYAFIIESNDQMAQRGGGIDYETFNFDQTRLKREELLDLAMFQYMIGNTDWKISIRHNIKIVGRPDSTFSAVPYDFDYSGLVNAPYAVPNPDFFLSSVKDRYFMLEDVSEQELVKVAQNYSKKKKNIYRVVDSFKLLSKDDREEVKDFLEQFFEMTRDNLWPQAVIAQIAAVKKLTLQAKAKANSSQPK